jgi:hypothetical protein
MCIGWRHLFLTIDRFVRVGHGTRHITRIVRQTTLTTTTIKREVLFFAAIGLIQTRSCTDARPHTHSEQIRVRKRKQIERSSSKTFALEPKKTTERSVDK